MKRPFFSRTAMDGFYHRDRQCAFVRAIREAKPGTFRMMYTYGRHGDLVIGTGGLRPCGSCA